MRARSSLSHWMNIKTVQLIGTTFRFVVILDVLIVINWMFIDS